MRPIEYRAWYKKEQKMFEVTNLRWRYPVAYEDLELESYELIDRDSKNCHRVHVQDRNVELMQYTGLLDKNGKKIFEGDIIKVDMYGDGMEVDVHAVQYEKGTWSYAYSLVEFAQDSELQWEVIGNVHEHPSLLDSTEKLDRSR